jgi:hypothetical protein
VKKEFLDTLAPPEAIDKIGQYFHKKTSELIKANSCSLIGTNTKTVNVVRDVLKLVPIYWAASEVVRYLSIRSCVAAQYIYSGWDPAQGQAAPSRCLHSRGTI